MGVDEEKGATIVIDDPDVELKAHLAKKKQILDEAEAEIERIRIAAAKVKAPLTRIEEKEAFIAARSFHTHSNPSSWPNGRRWFIEFHDEQANEDLDFRVQIEKKG